MMKKKEIISLHNLTKQILEDLEIWLKENNASVTVDTLPTWPVYESKMRQLLTNLITNAAKYKKLGQKSNIRISADIQNSICTLSIKDDGCGIPSKQIHKIFSPFHRLHSADEIEGTGLGLSICRRIIQKHEGNIRVESTEGIGSIFYISIPYKISLDNKVAASA